MLKPKLWLYFLSLISSAYSFASIEDYYPYKVLPGASNYGNTGLMETPNARFMPEANLRFNFSSSWPNEYTSLTASPFNWMEATYRYVEMKNQVYGPISYSGNQTFKDKGFDLKVLINDESYFLPALAVGLRDLAGTGLFSSEYFVASKKLGHLDISLGLGWGDLGRANNISNPFSSLDERFKDRIGLASQEGGTFNSSDWFSGPTSLFGGIEYSLPKRGLKLKLEYDPSYPDGKRESFGSARPSIEVKSRINAGIT